MVVRDLLPENEDQLLGADADCSTQITAISQVPGQLPRFWFSSDDEYLSYLSETLLQGGAAFDTALSWYDPVYTQFFDGRSTPTEVLVLRATIRQSLHDFDTAIADLGTALAREPRHPQALLTRATVLTVQGR